MANESKATISIGAKDETGAAFNSVERSIQKLQVAAATLGQSASQAKLYELGVKGASKAQLEAAESALKLTSAYQKGIALGDQVKTGLLAIGVAAATGLLAAYIAFDKLIDKAAAFQDMAEKTGDTAENIASLSVAAATGALSMDSLVSSSVKLTKNLSGVDDESKAAGAALSALGLNIEDFKRLKPADQFEALGKALNGFADGPGKTAAAVALLGKAGAEALPFLKELGQEGGRQVILTEQQIRLADDYKDKQAKSRAELQLYASAIATQALPAITSLQDALSDTAKELLGLNNGTGSLAGNTDIKDFADASAIAIAELVDGISNAVKGMLALYRTGQVVLSGLNVAGRVATFANPVTLGVSVITGQNKELQAALADRDEKIKAASKSYEAAAVGLGLADKVRARIANRPVANAQEDFRRTELTRPKAELKFNGPDPKAKKGTAGQEAKAQLALDLEDIRKANESLTNNYSNAEKIIEALRGSSLVDEREYYASKMALLNLNNDAQERALSQELERLQAEKLTGKDKIDNDRKILDVEARLAKLRENSVTAAKILSIQEGAAAAKLAQYYRDAEDAAKAYLETITRAQQRSLSGFGLGNRERDRIDGRAQIEDKYDQQRRDLEKSRRDAELTDTFGPEARNKYASELDRIRRFQAAALGEYDKYVDARTEKEQSWQLGASEALKNYSDDVANVYKSTQDVVSNAFKGMEDALVNFVKTGKLDFASLADSIISDLVRIQIRQSITGPLSKALNGVIGGNVFAGSSNDPTAGNYVNSLDASSDASGGSGFLSLFTSLFGGGRAAGGPVSAGSLYQVGEGGKSELLNVAGKQYLIPGDNGSVQPGRESTSGGSGGGNTFIFHGQQNKNEIIAASVQASRAFAKSDRVEDGRRRRS